MKLITKRTQPEPDILTLEPDGYDYTPDSFGIAATRHPVFIKGY